MIAAWMLYCAGTTALLALSALCLERGLRLRDAPVRWVWVAALLGSFALAALPWIPAARIRPIQADQVLTSAELPRSVASRAWTAISMESAPGGSSISPSLERFDTPLLLLWATLTTSGLLYLAMTHRKLARRRRRWRETTIEGTPVLLSRDVGPAVVGFIDAAIVIPEWVLAMEVPKRRLVLSHEEEHLRARDAGLLALALASLALLPWNAPLWWQVRRLRHAVEMDCDARVVRRCADARGYSALLIEVGERISVPAIAFAAFSESTSFLERRIRTMIALRTRRWKVALSASISAGVGLLVLACEMPLPPVPRASPEPEPVPGAASQRLPDDAIEDSPVLRAVEARQSGESAVASEDGWADGPTGSDVLALVERTQPEVYATGLSLDRAVWIAVDRDGVVQKSWIGPNLFINVEGGPNPNRVPTYPVGSAERNRASAELERAGKEEFRAHVPEMTARGGHFTMLYDTGPAGSPLIVYLVTEAAGVLGTRPMPFRW